jgi:hypothetical protein
MLTEGRPWRTHFTPDREGELGTERLCRHCDQWSLLESFVPHPRCIGGRSFQCRRCRLEKKNAWERASKWNQRRSAKYRQAEGRSE